jgi:hypothetical protein
MGVDVLDRADCARERDRSRGRRAALHRRRSGRQGAMRGFEAIAGVARGVSVTSNNAGDTGWTMTVAGYDIYGAAMSEAIAVTANSVAYGKKAFKFVKSCTPTKGGGGSSTGTLSVGTSDVIGLPLRSDYFEDTLIHWNAALLTANRPAGSSPTRPRRRPPRRATCAGRSSSARLGGGTGVTGSTDGTKQAGRAAVRADGRAVCGYH